MLLEAAREIQNLIGKTDLNFTKHEMQQVHASYCAMSKGITRTQHQLANRLKTLKKEFNIFRELATKSGWSWDYENHMIVPPTPVVLAELIKSEPIRLKYYDTKKYPWYELMTTMSGGRMATGNRRIGAVGTQDSAIGSSTGSSDDPQNDEPMDNETEDTIQQPFSHPGDETNTSFMHVAQSSIPASGSSGSQKRKSIDDSVGMSRGQKIQKRISSKNKVVQQMADNGTKMVQVNEQLVEESRRFNKIREDKERELDEALGKLIDLQLSPLQQNLVMQRIEDSLQRRFFLRAPTQQIMEWIACMTPQHGFTSQPSFTSQGTSSLNQQQGTPFLNNVNDAFNFFYVNPRPPGQ
ncbi:Myb/SANT-like DNA-binding domain-containing protein [Carex littledalei]|uniref:Myb/SANT-like DNA-binding domain-containing protein n=1 Tax=Carex littledalei TaxID=544730 RepID=A0A833QRE0_9POAL|nr:Myb/SANT-like DNA-binding domain-containing protein [Carex littledalei]